MKIKIAEWLADYLVSQGIICNFTVPGGGAMNMNMAFGLHSGMKNVFMQHEQSAAIAAEAYARVNNKIAIACVTSGPGGSNALTGVLGAWLDSIPMLVISGQVRYALMARSTGLNLRAMGPQEYDIVKPVSYMTKYAALINEPETIRYHVDKAIYLATHGRPGPVWLDITLDVQGATIDDSELVVFNPVEEGLSEPAVTDQEISVILESLSKAKRPVMIAGNGIRLSGGANLFQSVVRELGIPVTTCWDSIDLIETDHPLYVGRAGTMGDRPGNWAVQNSDFVLSVGSRLNTYQVGYDRDRWAPKAYTVVVDIDEDELKKPTVHIDKPIHSDAKVFFEKLLSALHRHPFRIREDWRGKCAEWKENYPVVQEKHCTKAGKANVYCFVRQMSSLLDEGQITVVGNGSASVVGSNAYVIRKNQRFIMNNGCSSMGYDLPAAIGACISSGYKKIICVTGDGSIQMNLQELQTIVFHNLPIKIFVINNEGYHQMRQTESNMFPDRHKVGIGPESGDIGFPDMEKISGAYGLKYFSINNNEDIEMVSNEVISGDAPALCEVFVDTKQPFEPKSSTRKLENGTFVSAPLEDLAPFLPREELDKVMEISKQ